MTAEPDLLRLQDGHGLDLRACGDLFSSDEAHALTLLSIVFRLYGPDVLFGESAPDAVLLYATLEDDLRTSLSLEAENRIRAMELALGTDDFLLDPLACAAIIEGVASGDVADVMNGMLSDITAAEAFQAFFEISAAREFSDDDMRAMRAPVREVFRRALVTDPLAGLEAAMAHVDAERSEISAEMLAVGFQADVIANGMPDPAATSMRLVQALNSTTLHGAG
jgi:hypothetical protein